MLTKYSGTPPHRNTTIKARIPGNGRPLCKPKPTCLSEESFGCTSAYFQSSFSTEQQNHVPLSNAASGEETAFEVFNSPQTSNSEEICSTDEVASVNACDVVVWHPLETPELILNQPLPAARLKAKTAEAVAAGGGRDFGSSNVVVAHCSTATYSLFITPPSYSLPSLPLLPPTTSETDLTLEVAQKTTEVATKCLTVPSVT
uniref:Uncharacterized protein TCIL3000_5_3780 n=1 Tax=Trypanosoma congolense (strain IL3000) TaxID=1068625 RepID=G0ULX4_TRYCI|nr:unnamed protein product [Trypanosoma congolense IL3000]